MFRPFSPQQLHPRVPDLLHTDHTRRTGNTWNREERCMVLQSKISSLLTASHDQQMGAGALSHTHYAISPQARHSGTHRQFWGQRRHYHCPPQSEPCRCSDPHARSAHFLFSGSHCRLHSTTGGKKVEDKIGRRGEMRKGQREMCRRKKENNECTRQSQKISHNWDNLN